MSVAPLLLGLTCIGQARVSSLRREKCIHFKLFRRTAGMIGTIQHARSAIDPFLSKRVSSANAEFRRLLGSPYVGQLVLAERPSRSTCRKATRCRIQVR